MLKFYFIRILLLLCSFSAINANASINLTSIELTEDKQQLSLSDIEYLFDAKHTIEIGDVLFNQDLIWQQSGVKDRWEYIDFNYSDDTLWLRAKLTNKSNSTKSWVWQIDYIHLNYIEFFQVDPSTNRIIEYTIPPLGDHYVKQQWSERTRIPYFNFSLAPGDETLIYIKTQSNSHFWLDSFVWPASKFTAHITHDFGFLSLFFGFMVAMFAYNLVLYVITKEQGYLYYVLYVGAQFVWQASAFGFLGFFDIVFDPWWHDRMSFIGPAMCTILGAIFIIHILSLKQNDKKSYYLILGVVLVFIGFLIAIPFTPFKTMMELIRVITIIACVLMLIVGIEQWRLGNPEGKYFTLAWSPLLISSVIFSAALMSLMEWSKWMEYVHLVGTTMEMFLLAMVLGSRINRERREREKAQHDLFEKEKEAITARAETKAKGEFFAKMSHEIRTPMNGVLGIVELLEQSELDADQSKMVKTIHSSGKSLLTIINDLLDLSKFESGKLVLETIPVNSLALIDETITVIGSRLTDGPVVLKKHHDIDTIPEVLGDPTRICQILMNLTSNALKFTKQGSVTLNQKLTEQFENHVRIRFEVIDTGIGISQEQQQKLFTPFVQADSSTTRQFGGTGLGLSICKELVELMDGEIGIESTPGEGTTFWFEIPFNLSTDASTSTTFEVAANEATFEGVTALVADDNAVNQSVMSGMLSKLKVAPTCFDNGKEALEASQSQSYDIILLDCEMPVMDGYTSSRHMREIDSLNDTPIIAVTAHSREEALEKCKAHGMDDLITKPVTIAKLREALANNIKRN